VSGSDIKVALIGCGRIAGHHARSIIATPGVTLTAVCDLAMDKARAYADEFGIPGYTDYRLMLDQHPDISLVAVITPSGMHYEHAAEIVTRYGKHVVLEKPTVMVPDDFLRLCDAADVAGVQVFPVFQNRYNQAVQRVRRAMETGELGKIRIVGVRVRWCRPQRYYDLAPWRGTFSHDGGCLTNQGIHHVDLLRYLGGEVSAVTAIMRTLGADIEVEDTVVATLAYGEGAVGTLEVTTAARPDDFEASISLVGEKGLAQIGGIAVNELQVFTPDPAACAVFSEDFKSFSGHGAVYGFGHGNMYRDIVGSLTGAGVFPVDRQDCLSTLRLLHAFYRSDEAGGAATAVDSEQCSTRLGRPNEALSNLYRTPEVK